MDAHDLAAKGAEQKWSKVLSLEQQRKFEELRGRRLQLKNAQDVVISGKKKKKKKRGNKQHPGSSSPKAAVGSEKQQPSEEQRRTTETAKFGRDQRHVFAVTTGAATAGEGQGGGALSTGHDVTVSQSTPAGRGEGNLEVVPSMTSEKSSGMMSPTKTSEGPQKEIAASTKKKRKKLRWGLEIKERWERKSNM